MSRFFYWFVKITAWPVQKLVFRTKIFFESNKKGQRKIKGPAIVVSNHTSVYDYAVMLFVFRSRVLRYQMAEVLFKKRFLGWFLKAMGGIKVDRDSHDFGFIERSKEILDLGGVVGVFPESRLPKPEEERPLPFRPSAAYLSLYSGVPVVPVYISGGYFKKNGIKVVIGDTIDLRDRYDESKSEKENLESLSDLLRDKIIELGTKVDVKQN